MSEIVVVAPRWETATLEFSCFFGGYSAAGTPPSVQGYQHHIRLDTNTDCKPP
jgi:hypothetical protein